MENTPGRSYRKLARPRFSEETGEEVVLKYLKQSYVLIHFK